MNDDVYRDAVMRVLPAVPDVPLEAPPAESFDFAGRVEPCPNCGGGDAVVQQVEDVEVAKCGCGCEFPPRMESVTRKVIRGISERRQRRFNRWVEQLATQTPAGLDPTDYALFRKIVDVDASAEQAPEEKFPTPMTKRMPPR